MDLNPPEIPVLANLAFQAQLWKVVIGWVCVIVFTITAVLSVLAISGFPVLAEKKYRDKLFIVLIVEIVGIALLVFRDAITVGELDKFEIYSVIEGPHKCDYGKVEAYCKPGDILVSGGGSCGYCSGTGRMEANVPIGKKGEMGWLLACDEGGDNASKYDGGQIVIYCQSNR